MDEIKCIIVEDELPAIEEIKYYLSKYPDFKIIDCANNMKDAVEKINNLDFDVAFLDINIPGGSGIELCNIIKNKQNRAEIIFITAYDEYAVKAFEFKAVDYLLKPINENRFDETINRLRDIFKYKRANNKISSLELENILKKVIKQKERTIPCEINGKIILIDINEVFYFFIENDKTFLKTSSNQYEINYTLNELEKMTDFLRTHRSFLVNPNKVKEIHPWFNGTYKLIMKDDKKSEIPVSRSKAKLVKDYYNL